MRERWRSGRDGAAAEGAASYGRVEPLRNMRATEGNARPKGIRELRGYMRDRDRYRKRDLYIAI